MSCSTCAHNGNLQIKPVVFHSCVDLLCLFWHACWLLWMYVGLIVWAVFSSMLSYMFCRKAILSSRNTLLNREHVASRMLHNFGWVMKPHELAWVVLWDTFFPLINRLKQMFPTPNNLSNPNGVVQKQWKYRWKNKGTDGFTTMNEFEKDPHDLHLGLRTGGVIPFTQKWSMFSVWPTIIVMYNIPASANFLRSFSLGWPHWCQGRIRVRMIVLMYTWNL